MFADLLSATTHMCVRPPQFRTEKVCVTLGGGYAVPYVTMTIAVNIFERSCADRICF